MGEEVLEVMSRRKSLKSLLDYMMRCMSTKKNKDIILSGKLGKVVSLRAQLTCWYPDMPGSWRQKTDQAGGGALTDMGSPLYNLIQYVTGSKARKVAALTDTKVF